MTVELGLTNKTSPQEKTLGAWWLCLGRKQQSLKCRLECKISCCELTTTDTLLWSHSISLLILQSQAQPMNLDLLWNQDCYALFEIMNDDSRVKVREHSGPHITAGENFRSSLAFILHKSQNLKRRLQCKTSLRALTLTASVMDWLYWHINVVTLLPHFDFHSG